MFDRLIALDQQLMLQLNGSDSLYMDGVMKLITSTWVWMPLALAAVFILAKNNSLRSFLIIAVAIAATVWLCDGISSGIVKPRVARFRPTNEPLLLDQIDIVNGSRFGRYGFFSSHAANSFGIFMFIALLVRHKALSWSLFVWAAVNSFSRIYLGAHYPGDILCGAIFGVLVAVVVYVPMRILLKHTDHKPQKITDFYTPSGYLMEDVEMLLYVLYATYAFIFIYSFVYISTHFL